jgi:hypothetical protein
MTTIGSAGSQAWPCGVDLPHMARRPHRGPSLSRADAGDRFKQTNSMLQRTGQPVDSRWITRAHVAGQRATFSVGHLFTY